MSCEPVVLRETGTQFWMPFMSACCDISAHQTSVTRVPPLDTHGTGPGTLGAPQMLYAHESMGRSWVPWVADCYNGFQVLLFLMLNSSQPCNKSLPGAVTMLCFRLWACWRSTICGHTGDASRVTTCQTSMLCNGLLHICVNYGWWGEFPDLSSLCQSVTSAHPGSQASPIPSSVWRNV